VVRFKLKGNFVVIHFAKQRIEVVPEPEFAIYHMSFYWLAYPF